MTGSALTTPPPSATVTGWPALTPHASTDSPPPAACPSTAPTPASPSSAPAPATPAASPAPSPTATGKPPRATSPTNSSATPPPTSTSPQGPAPRWTPVHGWPHRQPWKVVARQHRLYDPDTWTHLDPANASGEQLDRVWAALHAWEQRHLGTLIADVARRLRKDLVEPEAHRRFETWVATANELDAA